MPPQDGITIAHFITVADIERSARFYEKVFGDRVLSRGDIWRSRGAEFITEPKDKYGETHATFAIPMAIL
jgi:predicted enzyme related to lactoylglutathione lyase